MKFIDIPAERLAQRRFRKGDKVSVWGGKRRGVVRGVEGNTVHVELDDGKVDPPSGYSAWWPRDEVVSA